MLNLFLFSLFVCTISGTEDENLCVEVFYEAFSCFGCPLFNDKTSIDDVEYALKKFAENQQLPADQKVSMLTCTQTYFCNLYTYVSILYFIILIVKHYCESVV